MSRAVFEAKIRTLVDHAWDQEVRWPNIEAWAENFHGGTVAKNEEQLYALLVLTRFLYFGKRMLREMLKSLYRDHFEAPQIQRIRRNYRDTRDIILLRKLYVEQQQATRFLGVGNPAESGAHLLYYFRQVNYLPKDLFVDFGSAFVAKSIRNGKTNSIVYLPRQPGVSRYVFFDDLVGSGTQASGYLEAQLKNIRRDNPNIELKFMCLFATTKGLARMNDVSMFNGNATCLFELDDTYKAFSLNSRYFEGAPDWFSNSTLRDIASKYGNKIQPSKPLGYRDGQLLLGFSHNTPDNTLPIFWDEGSHNPWSPIFVRYDKVYN